MSEGFQAAQRAMYAQQAKRCDVIITTALIPARSAQADHRRDGAGMKPGSVIVDMAAEQGGNCELTEPGQAVVKHGVTIVGYTDLASRLAKQSSTLYSNNLLRLTEELCKTKDGVVDVNMDDDAIRGLTVIKDGTVTGRAAASLPAPVAKPKAAVAAPAAQGPRPWRRRADVEAKSLGHHLRRRRAGAAGVVAAFAPAFPSHFTVFVLAWPASSATW